MILSKHSVGNNEEGCVDCVVDCVVDCGVECVVDCVVDYVVDCVDGDSVEYPTHYPHSSNTHPTLPTQLKQSLAGEKIFKGHRSYDLMLNLQLGVRYTITNTTAHAAQLAAGTLPKSTTLPKPTTLPKSTSASTTSGFAERRLPELDDPMFREAVCFRVGGLGSICGVCMGMGGRWSGVVGVVGALLGGCIGCVGYCILWVPVTCDTHCMCLSHVIHIANETHAGVLDAQCT